MNSTAFQVRYKDQDDWAAEVVPWDVVFNKQVPYNLLNVDHLYPPGK